MSHITRFAVRSSGRDVTLVRRPKPNFARSTLAAMKKADVVAIAEDVGVDPSGTKDEIVDRLAEPTDG